ncbi:hypothetical protein PoB_004171500 [Plakobranchus ocellatus]|uniref:Uncharacterized protein n=1 Tax=Plakobranchus ocellatus TaxID=259542 RepID=A0AAV4B808_9GAST|nr:hypothetical protein PoB_004171500 [Plakobranchus ocellatus]
MSGRVQSAKAGAGSIDDYTSIGSIWSIAEDIRYGPQETSIDRGRLGLVLNLIARQEKAGGTMAGVMAFIICRDFSVAGLSPGHTSDAQA